MNGFGSGSEEGMQFYVYPADSAACDLDVSQTGAGEYTIEAEKVSFTGLKPRGDIVNAGATLVENFNGYQGSNHTKDCMQAGSFMTLSIKLAPNQKVKVQARVSAYVGSGTFTATAFVNGYTNWNAMTGNYTAGEWNVVDVTGLIDFSVHKVCNGDVLTLSMRAENGGSGGFPWIDSFIVTVS